jgi:hypothetical protein
MWEYHQRSGALARSGVIIGHGHSGHGSGLNAPDHEAEPGIGPIPRGRWRIAAFTDDHPHLGPFVAALSPVGHAAHGRSEFFMHGDNKSGNRSASHGCIVANRALRDAIAASGDTDLMVLA